MPASYIPASDGGFNTWIASFSSQITATPTAFGLVAGQATALAALVTTWNTAYAAATNPLTRTSAAVQSKDTARAAAESYARSLANIVQGYPSITDTQLNALGLTVRSTTRTPIGPPATSPVISILGIVNRSARLAIADETSPDTKARPFGVVGLQLFYQVAGVAPLDTTGMTYAGLVTRTPIALELPEAASGKLVYMLGRWVNAKGQVGPLSSLAQQICG